MLYMGPESTRTFLARQASKWGHSPPHHQYFSFVFTCFCIKTWSIAISELQIRNKFLFLPRCDELLIIFRDRWSLQNLAPQTPRGVDESQTSQKRLQNPPVCEHGEVMKSFGLSRKVFIYSDSQLFDMSPEVGQRSELKSFIRARS